MGSLAALISHSQLEHWLSHYGLLAVFLVVGAESLGIPVPGETMLIAAALYSGTTHKLSIALIVLAAAGGAIVGDNIGYMIGRHGGWRLLRRYGHRVGMHERRLKLGRYLFLRHGGKVVFFGRFVSVLRTYAALLAGANHMPAPRFFVFNATGGVIWASIFGFGYYYAASVVKRLNSALAIVAIALGVALIAAVVLFIRRNMEEWEERAERALPGPLW